MMWTLAQPQLFVADAERTLSRFGWHAAITGSVLFSGESTNDLDLVVYPHTTAKRDVEALNTALLLVGLRRRHSLRVVREHWRSRGRQDEKHVESWMCPLGRRVDIFVLS